MMIDDNDNDLLPSGDDMCTQLSCLSSWLPPR
jgi:hypothetical protein